MILLGVDHWSNKLPARELQKNSYLLTISTSSCCSLIAPSVPH